MAQDKNEVRNVSLVSILIPTRHRPTSLLQCVISAHRQDYPDVEIIISDDSENEHSEETLRDAGFLPKVRYMRNARALGQAGNVNQLFDAARGQRLVLIHDDDWLAPQAVSRMVEAWTEGTVAVFGLQLVSDDGGSVDSARSSKLNDQYQRRASVAGPQANKMVSAFVGQFPNDGYMIDTRTAQRVRYSTHALVGPACDLDFGIRLAAEEGVWKLIEHHTSVYRVSRDSIQRGPSAAMHLALAYRLLSQVRLPRKMRRVRIARLREVAPGATLQNLLCGRRLAGLRIVLSGHYPLRPQWRRNILIILLLAAPHFISQRLATRW